MNKYILNISAVIFFSLSMTLSVNAETYSYDTTGRLTSVTYDDGSSIAYSYDANGNRLSRLVTLLNVAPIAVNDSVTLQTDTNVDINVLTNDTDSDGTVAVTTVAIVTDASNGTTSVNATTGVVTYTSATGYTGTDSFTYTVNDNEGATSNIATVVITVQAAPVNQSPVANDDSATAGHNTAAVISVLANDTDSDGTIDATTVAIVADATNGTTSVDPASGAVTYTPAAGYSGADSFTYTVNDNEGATSNVATVSITVAANQSPVANNDSVTTNYNTAAVISVLGNDTDADGTIDASSVSIVTAATNGTTSVATNGQVTYTPNSGYSGADSFTYTVNDNEAATSNAATVSITVNAMPPPTPPPSSGGGGGGSMGGSLLLLMLAGLTRRYIRK